jgi:hypothetical protein
LSITAIAAVLTPVRHRSSWDIVHLSLLAIPFPAFDPVLVQVGPLAIRWYALAYIAGLLLGWQLLKRIVQRPGWSLTPEQIDDLLFYATLGIILGGRLGFVLFYHPELLPQPSVGNPRRLAGRDVVPRRADRHHRRRLAVRPPARALPFSRSPMRSPSSPRSGCFSGGLPTSSMPSSGAG